MARRTKKAAAAPAVAAPPVHPESLALPPLGEPLVGEGDPLRIVAHLGGPVALPYGPLALDSLLAWAVCVLDGHLQPVDGIRPVEIPVAREPGGRFHLCSFSVGEVEEHEATWVNRRFPVPEAQGMAVESFKRIQINAGAQKSYRIPLELQHMRDDQLVWYAVGDRARIAELLQLVTHLGKRRAVGHGRLMGWTVEPCETWPGFPVVRDGLPLRPLPLDWPGLAEDCDQGYRRISYPYWLATGQEACAVPATEAR